MYCALQNTGKLLTSLYIIFYMYFVIANNIIKCMGVFSSLNPREKMGHLEFRVTKRPSIHGTLELK